MSPPPLRPLAIRLALLLALAGPLAPVAAGADDRAELERVTAEIQRELELRFSDPNDPGLYERRVRLRALFREVPRAYAPRFGIALVNDRRELAELFRYKLATPTRDELVDILVQPLPEERERYAEIEARLRSELEQLDPAGDSVDRIVELVESIPSSMVGTLLEETVLETTETGRLWTEKIGSLDAASRERLDGAFNTHWKRAEAVFDEVIPER